MDKKTTSILADVWTKAKAGDISSAVWSCNVIAEDTRPSRPERGSHVFDSRVFLDAASSLTEGTANLEEPLPGVLEEMVRWVRFCYDYHPSEGRETLSFLYNEVFSSLPERSLIELTNLLDNYGLTRQFAAIRHI